VSPPFTFEKEHPRQSVSDHQILLAFLSDEEAELFYEWLQGEGTTAFQTWLTAVRVSRENTRD